MYFKSRKNWSESALLLFWSGRSIRHLSRKEGEDEVDFTRSNTRELILNRCDRHWEHYMEHWTHLENTGGTVYAAIFIFTTGVIIWLAWARFFPESSALKKVSHFAMAFAAFIYFAGGYAQVVAKGLDGVTCAAGRHSSRAVCFTRDESPVEFWVLVSALTATYAALVLASVACMVLVVSPAQGGGVIVAKKGRCSTIEGGDEAPGPRRSGRLTVFKVLGGVAVILPLAWVANSFRQADGARKQVAEALASVDQTKAAVEEYLQDNGALPEDNGALGLPPPADFHGAHVSEIEIFEGHIILTFDDSSVDEHLRSRVVTLVAVRRGKGVTWHCASPDIGDKYLPRSCRIFS